MVGIEEWQLLLENAAKRSRYGNFRGVLIMNFTKEANVESKHTTGKSKNFDLDLCKHGANWQTNVILLLNGNLNTRM
jgi:hypothetical protein